MTRDAVPATIGTQQCLVVCGLDSSCRQGRADGRCPPRDFEDGGAFLSIGVLGETELLPLALGGFGVQMVQNRAAGRRWWLIRRQSFLTPGLWHVGFVSSPRPVPGVTVEAA